MLNQQLISYKINSYISVGREATAVDWYRVGTLSYGGSACLAQKAGPVTLREEHAH